MRILSHAKPRDLCRNTCSECLVRKYADVSSEHLGTGAPGLMEWRTSLWKAPQWHVPRVGAPSAPRCTFRSISARE